MDVKPPYGRGEKTLRLPPDARVDLLAPRKATPLVDMGEVLSNACRRPVGGPPLEEMVRNGGDIVILVSDLTRNRGAETVLPLCVAYLKELGVDPVSIRIIIARGTHRKLTKLEKKFFKKGPFAGLTFEEHDCDKSERLSALLLTRRGTPVRVNLALKDAGLIIILSPVSFHYFAGFGGGRKLVLPGCADRQAILANHRLSLVDERPVTLHPRCRPGVLEGNPVHEDMCETIGALKRVFALNFFADKTGDIIFLNAGDAIESHTEACGAYRDVHTCTIEDPYDVVVLSAGGYPHDMNFLQSHKALRHATAAVRDGGAVLYFAECEEGIGSTSLETALALKKKDFLSAAYDEYDLNNQTAVSLHGLSERFEIGMVSEMNVDILLSCGIKSCVNGEAFLAGALEKHGTNRIAVILDGNSLLVRLKAGGEP